MFFKKCKIPFKIIGTGIYAGYVHSEPFKLLEPLGNNRLFIGIKNVNVHVPFCFKSKARFIFGNNLIVSAGKDMGSALQFLGYIVKYVISVHILEFALQKFAYRILSSGFYL
jgi:hypothetical protein